MKNLTIHVIITPPTCLNGNTFPSGGRKIMIGIADQKLEPLSIFLNDEYSNKIIG